MSTENDTPAEPRAEPSQGDRELASQIGHACADIELEGNKVNLAFDLKKCEHLIAAHCARREEALRRELQETSDALGEPFGDQSIPERAKMMRESLHQWADKAAASESANAELRAELEIRTRQRDYWQEERQKLFKMNGDLARGFDAEAFATLRASLAASESEVAGLRAALERSQKNEAVCHCGKLVSAHGMGSGHSPIAMEEECPAAQLQWWTGAPDVPEGGQRAFLVSSGKSVLVLLYSNRYVAPMSDAVDDEDAFKNEVAPDSGEYYWTGWFEESCSACDTFWRWNKPVDGWMPLPTALLPAHAQTKST
jgi:hypothetical protein